MMKSRGFGPSRFDSYHPRDKRRAIDYMSLMINLSAKYWYFRSSLAAGGLRSI